MASATMGLRRRVPVPTTSVAQSSAGGKRSRSENNNSPSQGNLNSLGEPAPKKSRTSTRSKSKELEMAKKIGPPLWSDPRPYAQIAGLSLNAQAALCSEPVGLPSPMSYMSATMATFVGNAASLGKSPAVSYLDISNMTGRPPGWLPGDGPDSKLPLSFSAAALAAAAVAGSYSPKGASAAAGAQEASTSQAPAALGLPKNFPNDSMFAAYQPWVIKTYGDLAKTKTITIKKYARILRTLRGEEVNSAENSKFRFWVKSKGFHIGQPEGYEAKPADRIIGRHAVTSPGLDPPLYVPTQPPHNKALNGAEGTIPPGRVYKKVAIVENFFDIIHAVHVDLEGRPGKHAGQKRTYRTITETYAFLPREAVTRFLLGCTECQRRPRTPSPTSLNVSTPTPPAPPVTPPITSEKPPSPQPATVTSSEATVTSEGSSNERSRESSHPPESKSGDEEKSEEKQEKPQEKQQQEKQEPKNTDAEPTVEMTSATTSAATPVNTTTSTAATTSNSTEVKNATESSCSSGNSVVKNKIRDEKYNPLSITNLLRKDPIVRRPPYPIATAIVQHIPEPEPLTRTPTPTSVTATTETTTSTTSSAMSTEHSSASLTTTTTTTTSGSCHPRKLRMLPDEHVRRSTPSPLAASSQPRSWSPGGETNKCAPIDYSRPVGPSVQQTPAATGEPVAAPVGTEDSQEVQKEAEAKPTATPPPQQPATSVKSETTTTTTTAAAATAATSESSSESESEVDDEQRGFSPAAGLIDTNLNLLATIQQLHCQVMLALTERLRPPVPASPVASAGNDS